MKTSLKIVGIFFWMVGFALIVYVVREVLSHPSGYNSLPTLIGPLIFHAVCMVVGGFCLGKGLQKAPVETQKSPTTG